MVENNWSALVIGTLMMAALFKFSAILEDMDVSRAHDLRIMPTPVGPMADDLANQLRHMTRDLR